MKFRLASWARAGLALLTGFQDVAGAGLLAGHPAPIGRVLGFSILCPFDIVGWDFSYLKRRSLVGGSKAQLKHLSTGPLSSIWGKTGVIKILTGMYFVF